MSRAIDIQLTVTMTTTRYKIGFLDKICTCI
nr:MAG TPA: hypothetical protein [Siphoviridae sp. ctD5s5]